MGVTPTCKLRAWAGALDAPGAAEVASRGPGSGWGPGAASLVSSQSGLSRGPGEQT